MDVVLAGLTAECVRRSVIAPLDTLVVRLQLDRSSRRSSVRSALTDDISALARELRRPTRLYAGIGVGLVGAVPQALVYMPTYELLRGRGVSTQLASLATGVVCSVVRVPVAVVRTRLQARGAVMSARAALAEALADGWRGLYAGCGQLVERGAYTLCASSTPRRRQ